MNRAHQYSWKRNLLSKKSNNVSALCPLFLISSYINTLHILYVLVFTASLSAIMVELEKLDVECSYTLATFKVITLSINTILMGFVFMTKLVYINYSFLACVCVYTCIVTLAWSDSMQRCVLSWDQSSLGLR